MTDYSIDIIKDTSYTIELNEQGPQGIQGERGIQGPVGPVGPKGDIGPANTLTVGSVTKGEEAKVTIEGKSPNQTINFVLPKGDKGEAATITIGKVETVESNASASVTNIGTSTDSILDFEIPRGYKGEAATIVVGSTTTSDPGTEANVVNSGDENMAVLEFTIPKGEKGDKGDIGEQGPQGDQGIQGIQGPQGLSGISVTGVEQISKVGLVATYRMYFSDDTHFDYEVTDGSVNGITREQVISLIGYEPASYTSVEGLTTIVSTLEERIEDLTASRANVSLNNLDEVGEKRFTDIQTKLDSKQDKGNYALKSEIPTKISQLTDDSTFVHKTGNETIAGTKTFSSTINGNTTSASKLNGFGVKRTEFWNSVNNIAKTGKIINSANTPNDGAYIFSERKLNNGACLDFIIDGKFYQSEGAYQVLDTSTGVTHKEKTAVGSATKPVYINSNGVATVITSYDGNAATATKATQDSSGNNIVNTYATKTSLNTKADTSLSNLTEDGIKVIKDNASYQPPLLSTMWADHLLNDMSWLRADTFSWQSGNSYSLAYNELLSEYNNSSSTTKTEGSITYKLTPKGYKIALPNQETAILNKYNSDGIAWYYILDTKNKKFKLPRTKFGFEGLRTNVGDDIKAGLPNITADWNSAQYDGGWSANGAVYGVKNNSKEHNTSSSGMRAYFDASRSSSIYGKSDTVQPPATQMYLYFYVGNFTKSAEAQTAGLKAELLNGKADVTTPSIQAPYLKTTYVNGTSGYRIWSDGYCEQWAHKDNWGDVSSFTFLKTFKDTNYIVVFNGRKADSTSNLGIETITTTTIKYNNSDASLNGDLLACGYLAQGEY